MFKKLVAMIATIETMEDFNTVCGCVSDAFQHEKISYKDYELLFDLLKKIMPTDR